MKNILCEAFCAALKIRKVPVGYAVSTPYQNADGDPILLYLVRNSGGEPRWRVEDDGKQIPYLAAQGVNLKKGPRSELLQALLEEYGITLDDYSQTLHTDYAVEAEIGALALRFIACLLRLQDLAMLDPETVRNTFRADALQAIHDYFDQGEGVKVDENAAIGVGQISADVLLNPGVVGEPVAIFIATTEERGLLALVTKMEAEKYLSIRTKVVLLVERPKNNPLKDSTYALAQSRLDSVLSFRGTEQDAMIKLNRLMETRSTFTN